MPMSDLLKKIAYWALVLTLVVAEIGSFSIYLISILGAILFMLRC